MAATRKKLNPHDASRKAPRWNLTAPPEIRAMAKRLADEEGVSESKLVAMAIAAYDARKKKAAEGA